MSRRAVIFIIFSLVLCLPIKAAYAGQWHNILDDTRLTSGKYHGYWPSLEMDNTGNIHITWTDKQSGNPEIYYMKVNKSGAGLVAPKRISYAKGDSQYPQIKADSTGNLHITWTDKRRGTADIYYTKLDNSGNTMINDFNLTRNITESLQPSIGVDLYDNIHIVWYDKQYGRWEICYTKLDNMGNKLVDKKRITFDGNSCRPSLGVDNFGNIHLTWYDDRTGNWEIYYTKLDNNGNTLIQNKRITYQDTNSYRPKLAIDKEGNVHIVWYDLRNNDANLYYTKLDNYGNTKIADTRIIKYAINSYYSSICLDNSDNLHITWCDSRDGNWGIFYTQLDNNGNLLADISQLAQKSYNANWPAITSDDEGVIHMAWMGEVADYRKLYYTKGSALTIYVPDDYKSIQKAIVAASKNYAVIVAAGTYNENIDFLGKSIVLKSKKGPTKTIIEGAGYAPVVSFINLEKSESVIDGFTITNRSSYKDTSGAGGILCQNSSPTIKNCIISRNLNLKSGGGVSLYNSSAVIKNSAICENSALGDGGGIHIQFSSVKILNSTICNNLADGYGGGIYCTNSEPTIANSLVKDNSSKGIGNGISCRSSSPKIIDTTLINNYGLYSGGGVLRYYDSITIQDNNSEPDFDD